MYCTVNNGYEFIDFIYVSEEKIDNFNPVAGSFSVIICEGKYLLCFNTWRKQWELPAGKREENETAKECAFRELYEETGQKVDDLEFKGLIKVKKISNDNIKFNPVYFTTLDKLQPFQENNETSAIKLWDFKEQIGSIDEVDFEMLLFMDRYFRPS